MSVPRWVVVDDADPRIAYGGLGWTATNGGRFDGVGNSGTTYNNTLHGLNSNASLSFSFKGTRARLFGTTDIKNSSGTIDPTWDCIIDQKSVGPTEPFPYTQNNWVLCEWSNLSDANHTVTVKVSSSGQSFWADRIVYIPSDDVELKGATIMVSRLDPAVSFDTKWKPLGDIGTMTQTTGASVRIKFKGSRVTWQGTIPKEFPLTPTSATYSIDDQPEVRFSLPGLTSSQKASQFNHVFFQTDPLSVGDHELVVNYEGNSSTTPLVLGWLIVENGSDIHSASKGPMIGVIVGSVMGGLALMIAAAFAFLFIRKRMQARKQASYRPILVEEPFHYIKPFTLTRPTDPSLYDQHSATAYHPTTTYLTPNTYPTSSNSQITPYPFTAPSATSNSRQSNIGPVVRPPLPPPPVPQPMSRMERKRAEAETRAAPPPPQPRSDRTEPTTMDTRSQTSHSHSSSSHSGSRSRVVVHEDSGVRLPNSTPEELQTPVIEHPPHYTPG